MTAVSGDKSPFAPGTSVLDSGFFVHDRGRMTRHSYKADLSGPYDAHVRCQMLTIHTSWYDSARFAVVNVYHRPPSGQLLQNKRSLETRVLFGPTAGVAEWLPAYHRAAAVEKGKVDYCTGGDTVRD